MKLRVKREMIAYLNDRRYREGQIVDVPEKSLRKADKAYIEALELQRTKELGKEEAGKHGIKLGQIILPKWAELASKPAAPEPTVPGSGVKQPKDEDDSGSDDAGQNVL